MKSSRTYEIMKLAQKHQIDEYLSFNVKCLQVAGENAAAQNLHWTFKYNIGCPFDTLIKPTVKSESSLCLKNEMAKTTPKMQLHFRGYILGVVFAISFFRHKEDSLLVIAESIKYQN